MRKTFKLLKISCIQTKLILLILIVFITNTSYAQKDKDSLKLIWKDSLKIDSIRFNALNIYYKSYAFLEPDSVITITNYHINLAKKKSL